MTPIERHEYLATYWKQKVNEASSALEYANAQFYKWSSKLAEDYEAKKLAEEE